MSVVGDPFVGYGRHERMGVEEVVDSEGYDLRTTVSVPILVEVRSVVDRSPGVARLDAAPFPFVLLNSATDVLSMEEARITQLPQNGECDTESNTVFSAIGDDESRFFFGERRRQSLWPRDTIRRIGRNFARDRHATLQT